MRGVCTDDVRAAAHARREGEHEERRDGVPGERTVTEPRHRRRSVHGALRAVKRKASPRKASPIAWAESRPVCLAAALVLACPPMGRPAARPLSLLLITLAFGFCVPAGAAAETLATPLRIVDADHAHTTPACDAAGGGQAGGRAPQ